MNKELKVKIEGMSCQHCKASVEKALNGIDGIVARVDLEAGEAKLQLTRDVEHSEITAAIEDEGYDVTEIIES